MKKRILMYCPPGFSPARQYRGEGVFERLPKIDPEIEVFYPRADEPWLDIIKADLLFFMRSITDMDVRVAETAKRMGVPFWYDADDDYFNVSEDNPAYATYRREDVREKVAWFIRNADFMTVSTKDLERKYSPLREKGARPIQVIPNALDDYVFDLDSFPEGKPNPLLTWRGGSTHRIDLLDFTQSFWHFLERSPQEWTLLFIGENPKNIREGFSWNPKAFGERVQMAGYLLDYHAYMENFRAHLRPWAHVVPLSDNPFNRSKSNIAGLEAVYAGAIPIVPDWEEWQFPAGLKYATLADFAKCMEKTLGISAQRRREMWNENMKWVRENFSLFQTNLKRVQIVGEAVGSPVPA